MKYEVFLFVACICIISDWSNRHFLSLYNIIRLLSSWYILQLVSPTTLHEHDFVTAGLTETS